MESSLLNVGDKIVVYFNSEDEMIDTQFDAIVEDVTATRVIVRTLVDIYWGGDAVNQYSSNFRPITHFYDWKFVSRAVEIDNEDNVNECIED